jgi:hypothetical protein
MIFRTPKVASPGGSWQPYELMVANRCRASINLQGLVDRVNETVL